MRRPSAKICAASMPSSTPTATPTTSSGMDDLRPLSFGVNGGAAALRRRRHRLRHRAHLLLHLPSGEPLRHQRARADAPPRRDAGRRRRSLRRLLSPHPRAARQAADQRLPLRRAAYLTDTSAIPEESVPLLQDLDLLILDALRREPHPTHSHLENSIRLVEQLKPRRALFTHMSHDLDHGPTNAALPPHIQLAYDGLQVEFEITEPVSGNKYSRMKIYRHLSELPTAVRPRRRDHRQLRRRASRPPLGDRRGHRPRQGARRRLARHHLRSPPGARPAPAAGVSR